MSTFQVTLLENPRQNFRQFHRAVVAAYGAECPTIYTHGLLGFIVSDTQWAELPGNLVQPDDNELPPILPPRPIIVVPLTPAVNASSLTKNKYKMSPSSVRSEGGEAAAGYCLNSVSYRVDEAVNYNVLNSD